MFLAHGDTRFSNYAWMEYPVLDRDNSRVLAKYFPQTQRFRMISILNDKKTNQSFILHFLKLSDRLCF